MLIKLNFIVLKFFLLFCFVKNYGAQFENVEVGIHGPVQLIGTKQNQKVVLDLSNNQWIYKVGLAGEAKQLYANPDSHKWHTYGLPTSRMFVWYKVGIIFLFHFLL